MKKLETSMQPSSNPLIDLNARLDGPVFGGNSMADFPCANPESPSNSSPNNSQTHMLLRMVYEGHPIFDQVEAESKKKHASERASLAGKATRQDPLGKLIYQIVEGFPDISEAELIEKLKGLRDTRSIITDIDEEYIYFENYVGKHLFEDKCLLSAIKHRLSRAKKKYRTNMLAR